MCASHNQFNASLKNIARAAALLFEGKLVAFPTETVYGLGANAINGKAVARIFKTKGRPNFNPLIIHVSTIDEAEKLVKFNSYAKTLAQEFWPGPLTLVLPRRTNCEVSEIASAGLDTLAIRVPSHKICRTLLQVANVPIAAPSANRSGSVSPTTAQHVSESLGSSVDFILDDGPCSVGVESTILDVSGDNIKLLRPGGITLENLSRIAGTILSFSDEKQTPIAPGMLSQHYATELPLRMNASKLKPGEALIAFGKVSTRDTGMVYNLSESEDLGEAAANLFRMMRLADQPPNKGIAVTPIPNHGLGRAINDRLKRASHKRPLAPDTTIG